MLALRRSAATFRQLVNERGKGLRSRSFAELQRLVKPPLGPIGENIRIGFRSTTIVTLVEPRDDGSLRVVLRGTMDWRFLPFVHDVAMDGFYKHPDGTVTPMPDKEFLEFD